MVTKILQNGILDNISKEFEKNKMNEFVYIEKYFKPLTNEIEEILRMMPPYLIKDQV